MREVNKEIEDETERNIKKKERRRENVVGRFTGVDKDNSVTG